MVDTSSFQTAGNEILGKIVTGSIMLIGALFIAGIILGTALYIRYLRQFNIKVEIKSLRGSGSRGEPIYKIISDVGGFVENKQDKTRWFRLKGEKIDLPSPPLEALQLDASGVNHLKIYQRSDTEYYYLLPDRINTSVVVRDGKVIPVAQMELKISDGDVVYWGQLRKKQDRKMFDMESMLMKIIPYIGLMILFVGVVFLSYMITDNWGTFAAAADALREAAEALKDMSTAQVTSTGG